MQQHGWTQIIYLVKSEKRQILYDTTYTWNLKNNTNESIYKKETGTQTWKIIYDYQRAEEGGGINSEYQDKQMQTIICKINKQQGFIIQHRELYQHEL